MDDLVAEGQRAACRSPRCSRPRRRCRRSISVLSAHWPTSDSPPAQACRVPVGPFVVDGAARRVHGPRAIRSAQTKQPGRQQRPVTSSVTGRGRAAVRRAADPRPRRDRRRRGAGPAVRRPRRRGHQDRERRVSRRPAPDAAGPGDEQVVGVDPPQRVQPRPGPAASVGRRAIREAGRRRRRGVRQLQAGNACVAGLFIRAAA